MDEVDIQSAKKELLEAITYFVSRQELVAQAMTELGLDLDAIAILGAVGWTLGAEGAMKFFTVSTSNLGEKFKNALQTQIENNTPRVNQAGIWHDKYGNTWDYFLHGGGCRLTNKETGEPIDWDCPNPRHFDSFKFCFHLKWQAENCPTKYPKLIKYLHNYGIYAIELELIPELVDDGKLLKTLGNPYSLTCYISL